MDKITSTLLEALKQSLAEAQEFRLFRSGKLPGLFASRHGSSGQAAELAIREGMLEIVRSEARSKVLTEWVRATPKAVDFVHAHESPIAALKELQSALQSTQQNLPTWMEEIRQRLAQINSQVFNDIQSIAQRLDVLGRRVDDALARIENSQPQVSQKFAELLPWANDVVRYLDRRQELSSESSCPLSELFAAVKGIRPELTVAQFHLGLRRLFDRGIIRLLPWAGTNGLPEPEFALLDGMTTYCHVQRTASPARSAT